MRYWPRLGIYVTRTDAESYCSKVGGQHTHLDDDIEEFVPVRTHDEAAMRAEVATLFDNPPLEAPSQSKVNLIILLPCRTHYLNNALLTNLELRYSNAIKSILQSIEPKPIP